MSEVARSAMQRLPHELIHEILSLCDDPASLWALSRSCAPFYSVFAASETKLTALVLSSIIDPSVQRDAYVCLLASRLPPNDPYYFEVFAAKQLNYKYRLRTGLTRQTVQPWTIRDGVEAARFHGHVRYLAQSLADQLLAAEPFTAPSHAARARNKYYQCPPATVLEIQRFQRALYRFQMFCELLQREPAYELFCKQNGFATCPDVWLACYSEFATYEIEQLSCLNDLFMAHVAQQFNEIALHDVTWGHHGTRLITSESSRLGQQILSHGLPMMHALTEATEYSDYHRILHEGEEEGSLPKQRRNFLVDRFDDFDARQYLGHIGAFQSLSAADRARLIRRPFYPDPDVGPARLWEKVHLEESIPVGLVAVHQFRHYRRWGYVFWDEERLDVAGVFDLESRWAELSMPPPSPMDPFLSYWEIDAAEMALSRRVRSRIWLRGGRGYWDAEDDSQVVYPEDDSQIVYPEDDSQVVYPEDNSQVVYSEASGAGEQ